LLILAALVVVVVAQVRPQISETFEGEGYTHITTTNDTIWGLGHWAIDEPNGRSIERWEFMTEHRHRNVHYLKRFDLGWEYTLHWERIPKPHEVCVKRAVKPPMQPNWAWLKDARYHGKHVIDGTTYDLWGHHFSGIELEVAVSEHDASRPEYFFRRSPEEHRMYHFLSFHTFRPNASWFDVPSACKNATAIDLTVTDGNDNEVAGTVIAAAAQTIAEENTADAVSLVSESLRRVGVTTPSSLWELQQGGSSCVDGANVGDVFFDGLPATSAAIYLGSNRFAECAAKAGSCGIVPQRDFTGGCRRFQ